MKRSEKEKLESDKATFGKYQRILVTRCKALFPLWKYFIFRIQLKKKSAPLPGRIL
jgi:hypothetical protein